MVFNVRWPRILAKKKKIMRANLNFANFYAKLYWAVLSREGPNRYFEFCFLTSTSYFVAHQDAFVVNFACYSLYKNSEKRLKHDQKQKETKNEKKKPHHFLSKVFSVNSLAQLEICHTWEFPVKYLSPRLKSLSLTLKVIRNRLNDSQETGILSKAEDKSEIYKIGILYRLTLLRIG